MGSNPAEDAKKAKSTQVGFVFLFKGFEKDDGKAGNERPVDGRLVHGRVAAIAA